MQLYLVSFFRGRYILTANTVDITPISKTEKLLAKLLNTQGSFTWDELASLLGKLGYVVQEGSGSHVKFDNGKPAELINLHRPHPGNELKKYAKDQVIEKLKLGGHL